MMGNVVRCAMDCYPRAALSSFGIFIVMLCVIYLVTRWLLVWCVKSVRGVITYYTTYVMSAYMLAMRVVRGSVSCAASIEMS